MPSSPSVERPFGLWTAAALVVGSMIGSGIFVLPAQLAPYGWTSVAAWIAAIGGAILLAAILTGLASERPAATGAVAICGEAMGPLPGVLVGWSYWVGVWSANAIIAITAVRYCSVFVPALAATPLSLAIGSTVLIWLITLVNLAGARTAGQFQVVTTVLKLLPLFAIIAILGGLFFTGGTSAFEVGPHTAFAFGDFTPAITLVFFALVGFESASIAAERVRDPRRNIVRATMLGLALTGALYLVVSTGVIFALPTADVAGAQAPMALFVEHFWGPGAGLAIAAFAAIAAIGCLNGWILVQGEVPLGMARAGLLPRWVGRVNARDVPVLAVVVSSLFASVLVMSNASRGGAGLLEFMLRLTSAATLWLYVGACVAALILNVRRPLAILALAFALWAMWGAGVEAGGLSLLLMLTAIPLYLLRDQTTPATA